MPIPDDEKFEKYLRQFKPLAADPLPLATSKPTTWRSWAFVFSAAAALAVLVGIFLIVHLHRKTAGFLLVQGSSMPAVEQIANSEPLTLQRANALLARASSVEAALDGVAFSRQRSNLPQGSQSALATLSKEDIKL